MQIKLRFCYISFFYEKLIYEFELYLRLYLQRRVRSWGRRVWLLYVREKVPLVPGQWAAGHEVRGAVECGDEVQGAGEGGDEVRGTAEGEEDL